MACRSMICALVACCCLPADRLSAQGPPPAQGYGPSYTHGPAVAPGPAYPSGPGGPMTSYAPAQGHHQPPYVSPIQPAYPYQPATPETAVPGVGYYGPDGIVSMQTLHEESWDENGPIERFLTQATRDSWVRVEWLSWNIQRPGNTLLGAPLAVVPNPREPFPVFDFEEPPNQIGMAIVPDLDPIGLRKTDGFRGTFGMPLTFGSFEVSGFALARASETILVPGLRPHFQEFVEIDPGLPPILIIDPGFFAATSLFDQGQLSNLVELYNRSFAATFTSRVWGVEQKLVFDTAPPGEGMKLRPLVGGRFLSIGEQLTQVGVFEDTVLDLPPVTSVLDSETRNHLYSGTLGVRAELEHRKFTLGVEPRLGLGLNTYSARVMTENFRGAGDPTVVTDETRTVFSPVAELGIYAKLHLRENFSMFVSYNLLWASRVTRPHDNIFYNDNGPLPTPPGVVLDTTLQSMRFDGLTVGGELRFR